MTIKQTVDIPASRRITLDVPPQIPVGRTIIAFTPAPEEIPSPEIAQKLAQLTIINSNLKKLNETEPLLPEFEEILVKRVNFNRVLEL